MASEEEDLLEEAWTRGILTWKLRDYQLVVYETIWNLIERLRDGHGEDDYRIGTIVASRKIGKSYIETLVSFEFAIRYPGALISITAPTGVEARDVFLPEFEKILADCPLGLRPARKGVDGNWHFPNKSIIYLKGADMQPNRLRGPSRDLNMVDEAAYVNRLGYVVESVLYPMTFNTRGPTILASTLNKSPNAEFNAYHRKCMALGQGAVVDVYSAGFSEKMIAAEKAAVSAETWRIEYECHDERDQNITVVPEWTAEVEQQLVQEPPVVEDLTYSPQMGHWFRFTGIDFGTADNTSILTAYYDFASATCWITAEDVFSGAEVTAANISRRGTALEEADDAVRPIAGGKRIRVGDNDVGMLQSMHIDHGYVAQAISKPALEITINNLRTWVTEGRLRISPKCVNLLACLRHGAWKEKAGMRGDGNRVRKLAHSNLRDKNGKALGHFDALMALAYLLLTVNTYKNVNPLPKTFVNATQIQRHGTYTKERYFMAPKQGIDKNFPKWLPNTITASNSFPAMLGRKRGRR